jgi:hypothetical protein
MCDWFVEPVHTLQDKYYVILIIYNQLNEISCLKRNKIILMYLENINLFWKRQDLWFIF